MPSGASVQRRVAPGTISVRHSSPKRARTVQSQGASFPAGCSHSATPPAALSRTTVTRGAAGAPRCSQGDAGTSAGSAYVMAPSQSERPSTFCTSARALKCTLPDAPVSARVRRICSTTSPACQSVAPVPPTLLVKLPGQRWRPFTFCSAHQRSSAS